MTHPTPSWLEARKAEAEEMQRNWQWGIDPHAHGRLIVEKRKNAEARYVVESCYPTIGPKVMEENIPEGHIIADQMYSASYSLPEGRECGEWLRSRVADAKLTQQLWMLDTLAILRAWAQHEAKA